MPDADPATLTDEELDAALATPDQDPAPEPDAPTPPEPETPEPKDPETPEPAPASDPEPTPDSDPEDKPPSRRETLRIQQVLEKRNQASQPLQVPKSTREDALNYEAELNADPEIIKRLQDDRQRAEDARYQEGLQTASAMEWRTMVRVDTPAVEAKFPQLDKNSPEFHPALTQAMYDKYLAFVGYDENTGRVERPSVRFSDYVESEYELAQEMASLKTKETVQRIAQQANQTGLRPDGTTPTRMNLNQDPSAMSDEELDAVIAQAIPTKKR